MGGEYNTRTYKGKLSRKQVAQMAQDTTDEMRYEEGNEAYSGHWGVKNGGIDFCSTTFKSENEADDWLSDNNDKWGNIGACYFEEKEGTEAQNERIKAQRVKVNAESSTVREINRNISNSQAHNMIRAFYAEVLAKNNSVKAKTKKCKTCGTVHQVGTMSSVECIKCGTKMLSETEIKKVIAINTNADKVIAKLTKTLDKAKAKELKEQTKLDTLISKRGGKTKQGWLVGGWCSS